MYLENVVAQWPFASFVSFNQLKAECNDGGSDMENYFDLVSRSSFLWSPPGYGWSCYRTWEAICIGTIPIVLRANGPIDEVYADLPVLMVDDYTQITKQLLHHTLEEYATRSFDWSKVSWSYWNSKIRAKVKQ
jgi:hypothetical protein